MQNVNKNLFLPHINLFQPARAPNQRNAAAKQNQFLDRLSQKKKKRIKRLTQPIRLAHKKPYLYTRTSARAREDRFWSRARGSSRDLSCRSTCAAIAQSLIIVSVSLSRRKRTYTYTRQRLLKCSSSNAGTASPIYICAIISRENVQTHGATDANRTDIRFFNSFLARKAGFIYTYICMRERAIDFSRRAQE